MKSTYSIRRPVVNLRLVRERDGRLWREVLLLIGLLTPVVAGVLLYVWIAQELLNVGYDLRELEEQLERLNQEERRLRVEVGSLAGNQRIERLATEELGMTVPSIDQLVFPEDAQ